MKVQFDEKSFLINGQRKFLVSGEFPYFRVPKADWARRLKLFAQSGGNCVASYVPWLLHEPEEGKILFDDCDERNLSAFIEEVKAQGLMLILRPGPYVYSEMTYSGLPTYIALNYPQIKARDIDGNIFCKESISYLHPLFLQKVKRWYNAFSEIVKKSLCQPDSPIIMIQVDNELIGSHEWHGSIDYNAETMGFNTETGRYPSFLKEKYGTISALNEAYGTTYESFSEVYPKPVASTPQKRARVVKDYHDFYCSTTEDFAVVLKDFLRETGIDVPLCHNVASAPMIPLFKDLNKKMNEPFLLGVDNYYSLNLTWAQNNPTPQYFARILMGADLLKATGNCPTVMEMPAGSVAQIPPILKEDIFTCCMTNLATGVRGLNYYIFTGGKNPEGTSEAYDVYDFGAIVSAEGEVRDSYNSLLAFHEILRENEWLCASDRFVSVQIGTEWQSLRSHSYAHVANAKNSARAGEKMEKCALFSLLCGKYSGAYTILTDALDETKPLLICSPDTMSKEAQRNVISFLERGGKLLLLCTLPSLDENFQPCTLLRDYIGEIDLEPNDALSPVTLVDGARVYGIACENKITRLPDGGTPFAVSEDGKIVGFRKKLDKGEIVYLGGSWLTMNFIQAQMLENVLNRLGASACVENSNRTIFSTLFTHGDKRGVFLLNLYTGKQSTSVKIHAGKTVDLGEITLDPMQVKFIVLD
ncbi:MAG: beta-galactosidase [Clostridia bacterium]|nr:beta-galactosidase [Clostridia bacterium]